jgi:arsenate reductase (glutaredoxin)
LRKIGFFDTFDYKNKYPQMTFRIYHNPRCRKSRAGLSYLSERTQDFVLKDYIKEGISTGEIREILLKLNIRPEDLVRKQEDIYKKELKGKKFTDDEWIHILAENPKLIRRPVVVGKHKAVIGDPPDELDRLLK